MIESSTEIKFLPMTYAYDELFTHMMNSNTSPWTNNWTEVFDFTPHKKAASGEPNYHISGEELLPNFIRPLAHAKEIIEKSEGEPKSLNEVDEAVATQIV